MTPDEIQQAACRGAPIRLFFPDGWITPANSEEARAICAECPVIDACRAGHADERDGVWFGTTPTERGFDRYGGRLVGLGRQSPSRDAVRATLLADPDERMTITEIARRSQLTESSVKGALVALVNLGVVERIDGPHPLPKLYRWAVAEEVAA